MICNRPDLRSHTMKPTRLLLALALFAASRWNSLSGADVRPSFVVLSQKFLPGDSITIVAVSSHPAGLGIGSTVTVRGRYQLQSRPEAQLGFFLTTPGPSAPSPIAPKQMQPVSSGTGFFELEHAALEAGALHISFYPRDRGSSFGGVYFGPAKP